MRINKNLLFHGGLLLGLFMYNMHALLRFVPSVKHAMLHTIYICQSYLQNIPLVTFSLIVITFLYAIARFLLNEYKTHLFKKKLRYVKMTPNVLNQIAHKYCLKNNFKVIRSNNPIAFCLGIVNPKIYISTGLLRILNEKELEGVMLHELYHLENRDNLLLVVFHFFKNVLFLFPFINDVIRNFETREEVRADEKAVRQIGNNRSIITALKKMLIYTEPGMQYGLPFFTIESMENRIYHLVGKPQSVFIINKRNILISVLSFVVVTTLVYMPITTSEVHAKGQDVVVMCFGNQSCEVMCKQSQMRFFSSAKSL